MMAVDDSREDSMESQVSSDHSFSSFQDTSSQNEFLQRADSLLRQYLRPAEFLPTPSDLAVSMFSVSDRFRKRFLLKGEIGAGSFGVVFLAFDYKLERHVALKIPRLEYLASTKQQDNTLAEARNVAALTHPGIVAIHEVLDDEPFAIIVTEYIEGKSLANWLQQLAAPVPRQQAAAIMAQVAAAIHHAHHRGLLHRDIKPSNILMPMSADNDDVPTPRMTDFGLARRLSEPSDTPGMICGTLRYMAPEVIASGGTDESTSSDVYSMGLVLYEMLAGRVPFEGIPSADVEELKRVKLSDPPMNFEGRAPFGADLTAVVTKSLANDPSDRYESAAAMAADLERYLRGIPVAARQVTWPERLFWWCRREPQLAGLVAFSLLGTTLAFSVISTLFLRERATRVTAEQRADAVRHVLKEMSGALTDAELTNAPGMDNARVQLLRSALDEYRQLARDNRFDEQSSHELSVALHRFANVLSQVGRPSDAIEYRQECLELISSLRDVAPKSSTYAYDQFMNQMLLGGEFRHLRQHEQAATATRAAYATLNELIAGDESNPTYLDALGATLCQIGLDFNTAGNFAEAENTWNEAARRSQQLAASHPDHPLYAKHAVTAFELQADSLLARHQPERAEECLIAANRILHQLRQSHPTDRLLRGQVGNVALKLGTSCEDQRRFREAESYYVKSEEHWSQLAMDFPAAEQYADWLRTAKQMREALRAKLLTAPKPPDTVHAAAAFIK